MLRLAGAEADGAILNWLGAGDVAQCRREVGEAKTIAARLFVVPTEDLELARYVGRRMISSYLTVNAYAEFHRWLGRAEVLAPMWEAWAAGDRKAANEAIPDDVVDDLIIHGSFAACREHVARYVEAGVEVPVLAIVPVGWRSPRRSRGSPRARPGRPPETPGRRRTSRAPRPGAPG